MKARSGKDLTDADRQELATFQVYIRRIATLRGEGRTHSQAKREAYVEIYGEVIYDATKEKA